MAKVYVDLSNYHCFATNPDGAFQEAENSFFDGKCATVIEGYCYAIMEDGAPIYPWKPLAELDNAQREYERQLLTDYAAALQTLGVTV